MAGVLENNQNEMKLKPNFYLITVNDLINLKAFHVLLVEFDKIFKPDTNKLNELLSIFLINDDTGFNLPVSLFIFSNKD